MHLIDFLLLYVTRQDGLIVPKVVFETLKLKSISQVTEADFGKTLNNMGIQNLTREVLNIQVHYT